MRMSLLAAVMVSATACLAAAAASAPDYKFEVVESHLKMRDGVKLAVTYYMPTPKSAGEKFPAIIEEVPYRKDDFFYVGDYQQCSYFAKRGYVFARVDVRGTGGSGGPVPWREYSEEEIADLVEVVGQLAAASWSNGKVGMYGISWSAFNALMVAARKPPALKAIIAAHGSGDLFYNDVHYIDGVMHFDLYCHQIDTDNALPASPGYKTDSKFFADRFNQTPWIILYFENQNDGDFWRKESINFLPPLEVPAFLVGGLLDGYRDFLPQVFESSAAFVKGDLGPWNHAWPDYGKPGPNYDWYGRALRWWDYWLKGEDSGILDEPRLMAFLRDGDSPGSGGSESSGAWALYDTWPIAGSTTRRLHPAAAQTLSEGVPAVGGDQLEYHAGAGMAAGGWWGEETGDMTGDDAYSLVYDMAVDKEMLVVGMPDVSLRVSADAPLYNWTVRLEDVWPDGKVSLVSGCLVNPVFRDGRLDPKPLTAGEEATIRGRVHFTTWRFKPGHKLRLAVSNAQFPMAWPTPTQGSTRLFHGSDTWLELPLAPESAYPEPELALPPQVDNPPDAWTRYNSPGATATTRDDESGDSSYTVTSDYGWTVRGRDFTSSEFYNWKVNDFSPATASYNGVRRDIFNVGSSCLDLSCNFLIESDELNYYLTINRTLFKNSRRVGDRTWWRTVKRDQQTCLKTFRLDDDTVGYAEQIGNVFNYGVLSNDPLVLKAEYEAGFIQGVLQKDKLAAARDNGLDGFALYVEGVTSAYPPTAAMTAKLRDCLLRNYDYTINYIAAISDETLKTRLSRLAFRLLGVADGASREAPQQLDFSGGWLPASSTFSPERLALNYGASTVSFMDVYFLNAVSDVYDATTESTGKAAHFLNAVSDVYDATTESTGKAAHPGRCSAFVKKTSGGEILMAHNTWSCFLDRSVAMTYMINGDFLSMNSSPFGIIGSNNDFGYNSKGIMFTETTISGSSTPKTEALWMFWRSALAAQFAGSLDEFNQLVCLEQSGTYMCGFLLADTVEKRIGLVEMSDRGSVYFKPDGHGAYQIVTTPPGLSEKYDKQMLTADYIVGFNMPVSQAIRDDLKSYKTNTPARSRQLLSRIKKVDDIESAKALITYTAKGEPLSVFGRWDLGYGTTDDPKRLPMGSIDAKAVSSEMTSYAKKLEGRLDTAAAPIPAFWMKCGTAIVDGKPFIWNESRWEAQDRRYIQNALDGDWARINSYIR